jgi:hypothetical protein
VLKDAACKEMEDLQQHKVWWERKNNGVSKSWVMQDGCSPHVTRYHDADGAPWVFVYECKDSGIPMDALNVVYLFSPTSITNMRGAVVPTARLTPKLEGMTSGGPGGASSHVAGGGGGDLSKKWKVGGIWRHVQVQTDNDNNEVEDEGDGHDDGHNDGHNALYDEDSTTADRRNHGRHGSKSGSGSDDDDQGNTNGGTFSMSSLRNSAGGSNGIAAGSSRSGLANGINNRQATNARQMGFSNTCIHDMQLNEGLPALKKQSAGNELDGSTDNQGLIDLEKQAPVRLELFFPRVFYYDPHDTSSLLDGIHQDSVGGSSGSGNSGSGSNSADQNLSKKVLQKVFCMVVVTPARNFSLTEYVRLYIAENSSANQESMHRKEILQEILLDQIGLCDHLRKYMYYSTTGTTTGTTSLQSGSALGGMGSANMQKNPLDMLNMPSHDLFPGNYLCIQLAYRKIQSKLHRAYGIDHQRIFIEGFSQTVNLMRRKDLALVRQFNFDWHHSFYENCAAFEMLKVEERADFKAVLVDANAPWWPRIGEPDAEEMLLMAHGSNGSGNNANDNSDNGSDFGSDVDMGDSDQNPTSNRQLQANGGGVNSPMNRVYMGRDRVPPIMMCLLYDPLMGMPANISRTEWEQKIGGLPAFHVYCMSRAIYSSSSNPLLKPEHFMPEAVDMSATERWKEYMGDGDNPLINFYVAGEQNPMHFLALAYVTYSYCFCEQQDGPASNSSGWWMLPG